MLVQAQRMSLQQLLNLCNSARKKQAYKHRHTRICTRMHHTPTMRHMHVTIYIYICVCVNVCVHVHYASMTCLTRSCSHTINICCKSGNSASGTPTISHNAVASAACRLTQRQRWPKSNESSRGLGFSTGIWKYSGSSARFCRDYLDFAFSLLFHRTFL